MDMTILYAVALTFPDSINLEIDKLRERFKQYVNYTIVPHITLKMPFTPLNDITAVISRLHAIAEETRPFSLILDGIQFFEKPNRVAYVVIKNKEPVVSLHSDIVHSLKGLIQELSKEFYELDNFIPHVTIGESIPDDGFPALKELLTGHHIHLECEISTFSLYSRKMDGTWQPECIFTFLKK
jgi:2'-5' RNA ligase